MRMRLFDGKRLVSMIRKGNYAHAGGEEAINQMFIKYSKDPNRKILDIGCGQGGTAYYIQKQGYGMVVGVDVEKKSINYAKKHYPNVEFICSDVSKVYKNVQEKFNLICAFNSFYAFSQQCDALTSLRKVIKDKGELLIFDYVDYDACSRRTKEIAKLFLPIRFDNINNLLERAGWKYVFIENLDFEYERWYRDFVNKMKEKKDELVMKFGYRAFKYAEENYAQLLASIEERKLGGCIIKARPIS